LFRSALSCRRAILWLFLGISLPHSIGAADGASPNHPAIQLDQIGATVEKRYSGDGLAVSATQSGARLRCVFQKLDGEATREGLWLWSTTENAIENRFRVMAVAVGRSCLDAQTSAASSTQPPAGNKPTLPSTGRVEVAGRVARFLRPGLAEEYSVS